MKYKFIEHTADIEFDAYGKSLEEVFSNCAYAFVEYICKNNIRKKRKIEFSINGKDLENLLYNFLEEFIILFDSEHFVLSKILKIDVYEIEGSKWKLNCEIIGDKSDNYEIISHVKAVTYNSMFVKYDRNSWTAHVILDV